MSCSCEPDWSLRDKRRASLRSLMYLMYLLTNPNFSPTAAEQRKKNAPPSLDTKVMIGRSIENRYVQLSLSQGNSSWANFFPIPSIPASLTDSWLTHLRVRPHTRFRSASVNICSMQGTPGSASRGQWYRFIALSSPLPYAVSGLCQPHRFAKRLHGPAARLHRPEKHRNEVWWLGGWDEFVTDEGIWGECL